MTFENYKKWLKKVPVDVKIVFSGMVEPWLNKDCTKMLLYAYNQGYKKIGVFTTTMGMSLEDFRKIKKIPFTVFYVHLADAEGNTKIKVDEKYLKLLGEIKKSNIKNKKYMAMGKLHPKLKPLFSDIVEKVTMQTRAGNLDFLPQVHKNGPIQCCWPDGLKHNVLMPNGDILLCCVDYHMKHVLGNLSRNSYASLFTSREFKRIVKALENKNRGDVICRRCEFATVNNNYNQKSLYRETLNYLHLTGKLSRIKSLLNNK
jgi:radical SAM protein with 4Fe4S-binding SPASM domain